MKQKIIQKTINFLDKNKKEIINKFNDDHLYISKAKNFLSYTNFTNISDAKIYLKTMIKLEDVTFSHKDKSCTIDQNTVFNAKNILKGLDLIIKYHIKT